MGEKSLEYVSTLRVYDFIQFLKSLAANNFYVVSANLSCLILEMEVISALQSVL